MRQLINSTYITLDGVVEGPHLWPSLKGSSSDEGDAIQTDLLQRCDIVLMGRRTYDVACSTSSGCGSIRSSSDQATLATCCTAPGRQRRSTSWTRGS